MKPSHLNKGGHKVPVELATAAGTATDVLSAKFLLFTVFQL
jgi:hypothetical protein